MRKSYQVNQEEKKWLQANGRKLHQYWEDSRKNRYIFIYFFTALPFILTIIMAIYIVFFFPDRDEDIVVNLLLSMVGLGPGLITWVVAGVYYNIVMQNTTIFCELNQEETLLLDEDCLIYDVQYKTGEHKKSIIKFSDITEMVCDRKLREWVIWWKFGGGGEKAEPGKIRSSELRQSEPARQIPLYYENIDELMKIVEEKSGIQIVEVREVKVGYDYVGLPVNEIGD